MDESLHLIKFQKDDAKKEKEAKKVNGEGGRRKGGGGERASISVSLDIDLEQFFLLIGFPERDPSGTKLQDLLRKFADEDVELSTMTDAAAQNCLWKILVGLGLSKGESVRTYDGINSRFIARNDRLKYVQFFLCVNVR